MKYLNLTEGFNPFDAEEHECVNHTSFFFSAGEPQVKIEEGDYDHIMITSRITSMNEYMMLVTAVEAASELCKVSVFTPYFPGSRQDRRMQFGEPLSVKVFASIFNDYNLCGIHTFDNHSDVSTALLNKCINHDNHEFVDLCLGDLYDSRKDLAYLVSPDAGSNKKIKDLAAFLNDGDDLPVIKCDKTRNVSDGSISGFEVYSDDLKGADCYIVDDICDGGGTFVGLASELKKKNAGKIYLIVSHGIFSRGLNIFKGVIDGIYTTDSWRSQFDWEQKERECTNLVKIIPFKEFL